MSISTKLYNEIGYEDVYPGMVLRIVTEGPGIKSDVEGMVLSTFPGGKWGTEESFALTDYDRITFKHDPSTPHLAQCPEYVKDTTIELYEVIDAIPYEPKGVGAVVRVVNLTHPDKTMEAVKTGRDASWVWSDTGAGTSWGSLTLRVLSVGYDYIEVLSEGVKL